MKQTKRKGKALRNKQTIGLQIQAKKEEKKTNIGNDKRKEKEKDRGRNKRPRSPLPMLSSLKNITNDEVTNTKKNNKTNTSKKKKKKKKKKNLEGETNDLDRLCPRLSSRFSLRGHRSL